MSVFGNLTTEGVEASEDRLGGFRVLDTDAYMSVIKALYVGKSSKSNARSVTVIADVTSEVTGQTAEFRETVWVTNSNDENFYIDKQTNKKKFLPGYETIDAICQMTANKGLAAMTAEDKVINVYDPDQKKELPKSVPMLTEALGKQVILGIVKQTVNKQVKDGNGNYQDTADSRDQNVLETVFHVPSKLTANEAKRGIQAAQFYGAWVERNRGNARDKRTIKDGKAPAGGRPGMPPKAGDAAKPSTSLFGS